MDIADSCFTMIMEGHLLVYIGPDLPDEYTHSNYTMLLRGANAKAKANAAQGIPEMLLIANEREFEENRKDKHSKNAKYGWWLMKLIKIFVTIIKT